MMVDRDEVFLTPGEFHFAGGDLRIRTLLGSCVSITLWHPGLRVGGMCHYMLPSRRGYQSGRLGKPDGRYADEAILLFLQELESRGTRPEEYVAKMFGGGNQFPGTTTSAALDISQSNVTAGLRLLQQHRFVLTRQHIGGTGFRRLSLDVATGEVRLIHIDQVDVGFGDDVRG